MSSLSEQKAILLAQLAELEAQEKAAAAASGSSAVAAAASSGPAAAAASSGPAGTSGRWTRIKEARATSLSSASSGTTSAYRSGQAPITLPTVMTNYLPMPINPQSMKKKPVEVAVPFGSASTVKDKVAEPFGSASSSHPEVAEPFGSASGGKASSESDSVMSPSDSDSLKRSRPSSKPSEPHPAKQSDLRGVSYRLLPTPKTKAKKTASELKQQEVVVIWADEVNEDIPEWENIPYLKKKDTADRATWPFAHCSVYGCMEVAKWKELDNREIRLEEHLWKGDGKQDKRVFFRRCVKCVMQQEGMKTEGEAHAWIVSRRPDFCRKQKESEKYRNAKNHVQMRFPMMRVCAKKFRESRSLSTSTPSTCCSH